MSDGPGPGQLFATGVLLLLVLLGVLGMRRGWRRRAQRQQTLPAPGLPPADLAGHAPVATLQGLYVGSATAEDWLDRVVAHGLGTRAQADLAVHTAGVLLERDGSSPLWIPVEDLRQVRFDSGLAGKVVEQGGLLVLRWRLGEVEVDSGVRPRVAAEADAVQLAVQSMLDTRVDAVEQPAPTDEGGRP